MSRRERLTNRKEAKKYDNVDIMSLNNPFEDPDPDKYELNSPDHFQELPDMRTEWQKDPGAYDEETNFMMPLDDVPSWWGQGPKMASVKAEACLKIAEAMFPDAVDDFVDAQAVELMELPDTVVAHTLKRIAMYKQEAFQVEALVGKRAEAPADEEIAPPVDMDMEEPEMDYAEAPAEAPMPTEQESDLEAPAAPAEGEGDDEGAAALMEELAALDATNASINPSTEFGNYFEHDGSIEDISFGNGVTASADDLQALFNEEYVDASRLRKSANVNTSGNLKLSEHFGSTVPGASSIADSLWDVHPNVKESFN